MFVKITEMIIGSFMATLTYFMNISVLFNYIHLIYKRII